MRSLLPLLLVLALVPSCPLSTMENPVPPKPTPQVKDTNYCSAAEKKLQELNCQEGSPLKDGTSFTKFCEDTQNSGIFLNPKCISEITSCEQVDVCTSSK